MDPFAKHGIKHLSPSSIKLYRDQPAAWVCRYLMRVRDEAGPAAWRGTAVEAGLDHWLLFGANQEAETVYRQCVLVSQSKWDEMAQGVATDQALKEYGALGDFLKVGIAALKDFPPIISRQSKISIEIPGIEVPIIGATDYDFGDYGVDLKTTNRMPSEARADHVLQMAVYMKAKKKPFKLLYVTARKSAVYPVTEDMAKGAYERVVGAAHSIRHLLAKSADAQDALDLFAPDFSSFYWSPEMVSAVQGTQHASGPYAYN